MLECAEDGQRSTGRCPARVWYHALPTCTGGARSPGATFARGFPQKPAKWIDNPTYCDAMKPLLRLAARDTDHFSARIGEERKPQVH